MSTCEGDGWPSGYVPPKGEPSPTRYSAAHEEHQPQGRFEAAGTFQRYLSAIKALARVRKMGPAVQRVGRSTCARGREGAGRALLEMSDGDFLVVSTVTTSALRFRAVLTGQDAELEVSRI